MAVERSDGVRRDAGNSASQPRVPVIDDLRGIAAFMVVVCHAGLLWVAHRSDGQSEASSQLFYLGRMGVAVFFVISGLVIYRPFIIARRSGRRPDLLAYAVRRVGRIVPLYWVAIGVFAVTMPTQLLLLDRGSVLQFLTLAQIYSTEHYQGGLAVAWTLCIEATFYLAAPVIAALVVRIGERREAVELIGLLLLAAASAGVRIVAPDTIASGTLVGYFSWFAMGMILARLTLRGGQLLIHPSLALLVAVAGYVALTSYMASGEVLANAALDLLGLGLLATLTVAACTDPRARLSARWLGARSYGIYLFHLPLLTWLVSRQPPFWIFVLVGLSSIAVLSELGHRYVERPVMTRASGFRRGRGVRATTKLEVAAGTLPRGRQVAAHATGWSGVSEVHGVTQGSGAG